MAPNRGLGRGLGSLLGILDNDDELESRGPIRQPQTEPNNTKTEQPKVVVPEGEVVEELPIGLIDNNPGQPRKKDNGV